MKKRRSKDYTETLRNGEIVAIELMADIVDTDFRDDEVMTLVILTN